MAVPLSLTLLLSLALSATVSATDFPSGSLVETIDAAAFKSIMKDNRTVMVAFVKPDCNTCQDLAGEYSRAALGLYPYVPLYSVDCQDGKKNKKLCSNQGVDSVPRVKLYPRGGDVPAIDYDASYDLSASGFYHWASLSIPHEVKKYAYLNDVHNWVADNAEKPRALLLNTSPKIPLLWQVLGNQYKDRVIFGSHRNKRSKSSTAMGFKPGNPKDLHVVFYPAGQTKPIRYEGLMKLDSLSKAFEALLSGGDDLNQIIDEVREEVFVPDQHELEIQQKQQAEIMKLAHGGYSEFIDFEKAVKEHGPGYHSSHGYPGMMGDAPHHEGKPVAQKPHVIKSSATKEPKMPQTNDAGQIVLQAETKTGMPKTEVAGTETVQSATVQPNQAPTAVSWNSGAKVEL